MAHPYEPAFSKVSNSSIAYVQYLFHKILKLIMAHLLLTVLTSSDLLENIIVYKI
jgi:hypothetical protein